MTAIRKRLPSPAMVVAIIALIAALAGTGVAAAVLTKKKFKEQSVRGPITYVTGPTTNVPDHPQPPVRVNATCPAGTRVVGGGIKLSLDDDNFFIDMSYPTTSGWTGTVDNATGVTRTAFAIAICVKSKKVKGTPPAS
jgi:hypothetical protein